MRNPRKRFRSTEEMGRAFDETEVSEENSEAAEVVVDKRYDPTLTMRIPEGDLRRLKELADTRGMPTATLARTLLLERLREEQAPRAAALRLLVVLVDDRELRDTVRAVICRGAPKDLDRARRYVRARADSCARALRSR